MTEREIGKEWLKPGKMIITFIGPEGSGKTTIARRLAQDWGRPYVTTGDIIRDLAKNDPGPLGEECRVMFANHSYLKGETLLAILVHRFSQPDVASGLILDGGMRTMEETANFATMLAQAGLELPVTVVRLRIPGWKSFERLVVGEGARKRNDDTVEGVMSRLSKYYHQLGKRARVIVHQPGWRLVHVDATVPAERVYGQVVEKLQTME